MKHFFNRPESIVTEALDGLLRTHGATHLARIDAFPDIKVVLRADWDQRRVALVSGGGSGHEPAHAGFVGRGMLTAAVCGEIFASPSSEAVLAAIRAVTGPAGCLLIVKNYTGDRLNFGLAAEKARAEGFSVEMVIVADDIALPDMPQPRGIAGTLFVHKIAGHVSESGADLATVAEVARQAANDTVSLGMSLSSCSIPGRAYEERLGLQQGELGLGIHGEPGAERIPMQSATAMVQLMVHRLSAKIDRAGRHALLINNLGAVPPLEMALVANAVLGSSLRERIALTIGPAPFMTALNMNGFSLSLLPLNPLREAALNAAVGPAAWMPARPFLEPATVPLPTREASAGGKQVARDPAVEMLMVAVCEHLIGLEAELNALDARIGDGDTGSTLATGARSLLARVGHLPSADTAATLAAIGNALSSSMGGSSGVLLSIFFTAAGKAVEEGQGVPQGLASGLDRVMFYGGARPGDRTMIDALAPALSALMSGDLAAAAAAAAEGAQATASMPRAKAGRAAYIGAGQLAGVMDPGALAVARVFGQIRTMVEQRGALP